jgi:peptidoglycan/LPS O-acetylase OafA/YrhL
MVLGIVLALSTVTWYCIEEPFRKLGGWLGRRVEERPVARLADSASLIRPTSRATL